MADHEGGSGVAQPTRRGAATRARILQAAAQLMYARGVAATKLDDVRAVSGTSKSQLYRNFPDKEALVRDVIALQAQQLLADQQLQLQRLRSLRGSNGGETRWSKITRCATAPMGARSVP